METVSVLCLLLLLCSLSGAELQDNEILEQRKVSPESVNVPQPHPCLSDLHSVLREMSVKLAVLQTEMKQLQTLNQEQTAKLRELDTLKLQQHAHATELHSMKTWANVTENQVETLRRDRAVGRVAFSASLLASGSGTTGPYNTHSTLMFRHVVSNIGNAYSPNTGFFTAPVRGAYHFEFYVYGVFDGSCGSGAILMKNGEHVFMSWERHADGASTSASAATLLLEVGDVAFMRLPANTRIDDNENHLSSFSGHLLFPM